MSISKQNIYYDLVENLNSNKIILQDSNYIAEQFYRYIEEESLKSHPWLNDLTITARYIAGEFKIPHPFKDWGGGNCSECSKDVHTTTAFSPRNGI